MKYIEMSFICEELDLDEELVKAWVDNRLIEPADATGPYFDEEDFARIRLIAEVKTLYGANDDTIEVILHLLDQIHHLTAELKKIKP